MHIARARAFARSGALSSFHIILSACSGVVTPNQEQSFMISRSVRAKIPFRGMVATDKQNRSIWGLCRFYFELNRTRAYLTLY
jgi:hypothetical protein